jgi:hypothetical protein
MLLQGDADRIVNSEAPLKWFPMAGARDKSLWLIPGHLHELLNEPGWEETSRRILEWLDHRLPRRLEERRVPPEFTPSSLRSVSAVPAAVELAVEIGAA